MILTEVLESDKQEYNRFLAAHGGSFLQCWEWGDWQAALGYSVRRFWLGGNERIGAIQLISMPLPAGYFYWYAPYGPVLREGFDAAAYEGIAEALLKVLPSALFFRIEPQGPAAAEVLSSLQSIVKSTNIQPAITMVVDVGRPDEELLSGMHPKTRYNIKVAQRHGVVVKREYASPGHGLYIQEAVDLILKTQHRQAYRGHSKEYYAGLLDFFGVLGPESGVKVLVYKALLKTQLLAAGIMVDFGATRVYLYGGSSEDRREAMAPYLMHWQAMQDARAAGLRIYDLGGSEVSEGGERGFTRFKKGFGGRVVEFAGAYDIVCRPAAYRVYGILRKANRLLKKIR